MSALTYSKKNEEGREEFGFKTALIAFSITTLECMELVFGMKELR
jgi:hypothetical protein